MSLRKQGTSIVLIALAAIVAVYAWIWDRGTVTDAERAARATSVLPAFRRAEITRVEIARAAIDGRAAETIVLERDDVGDAGGSAWRLASPRREAANVAGVEALLQQLETATRLRKVDGVAPGLDAPRVRATITMGKVTYRLALGAVAPRPEGAAYAQLDGDAPIVVPAELARRLLATADAYRERTIATYAASEIAKLEVRGGATAIAIERGTHGDFVVAGEGTRASAMALEKMWNAIGEMRAEAFLDDAEADALVATPAFTVAMTPREPSRPRAELVVGGPCPGHPDDVVVVRRAPEPRVSACAPKGILHGLAVAPEALPDRRIFAANADEVTELRLKASPTATLDLARSGSGWHQRAPSDRTLAQDEVEGANALVLALTRAEGVLLDRAEWKLRQRTGAAAAAFASDPVASLVRGERGEEKVEIRDRDATGVVIHRVADDAYLRVPLATARLLEPRAVAVRGREIWGTHVESPAIVHVSTRCGVAQDVAHGDRGWTMTAPVGFGVDAASTLDVANAVVRAKAETWIADTDDGSFGFAQAKCTVAVSVAHDAGTRRLALVFGGDTDAGVYAHVEGEPNVFVVARAVRDAVKKLLVDRGAVAVDLATTSSVSLSKRSARAALIVVTGHVGGDAGAKLDDALAALRATTVVHLGPPARDEGLDTPTLEIRVSPAADAGPARRIVFGAATTVGADKLYFARVDGVDATFAVAKETVDAIVGAF